MKAPPRMDGGERLLRIGVLAPPAYPSFVRNTDLAQGVALLRLGEFLDSGVEIVSLGGLGVGGVLGPLVISRLGRAAWKRTGLEAARTIAARASGRCLLPPGLTARCDVFIGHGLLPWSWPASSKGPPLLWGPGYLPDDYLAALGLTEADRRRQEENLHRRLPNVAGVFLTSDLSVSLWKQRICSPERAFVFRLPLFLPSLPRSDAPSSRRKPGDERWLDVLFVGGEARRKNLPRVLEACARLERTGVPLRLTVVSNFRDGPVDVARPFVRNLGPQSNQEVRRLMNESDVLCVPSIAESFGIVFVEAMSAGCAVIAPDLSMQRSLFGEAVEFADPRSVESIGDALMRLSRPEHRRAVAQRGLNAYRSYYAPDVVARAFANAARHLTSMRR